MLDGPDETQVEEIIETPETPETPEVTEEAKTSDNDSEEKDKIIAALRKEFAASIRKEEKDKLYPTIEKQKNDLLAAEEAKKALELKLKEYEDKNLTADEKNEKRWTELAEQNDALAKQLERVSEEAAKEIYRIQLEATREKVLAKYGEEIVPEMVVGSTIEEIQQSAEKANSVYLNIKAKAEEAAKAKSKTQAVGTKASPTNVSGQASGTDMDIATVKGINDPAEWAKVKEKLLEKAFSGM